jgi:microcystin-dependent protein
LLTRLKFSGGGTWERIKDRFLLAAGDSYTAGDTGGEATHTLTTSEIPDLGTFVALNWSDQVHHTTGIFKNGGMKTQDRTAPAGTEMGENYIKASGGEQAHNNMPPYQVVYIWKRTA